MLCDCSKVPKYCTAISSVGSQIILTVASREELTQFMRQDTASGELDWLLPRVDRLILFRGKCLPCRL